MLTLPDTLAISYTLTAPAAQPNSNRQWNPRMIAQRNNNQIHSHSPLLDISTQSLTARRAHISPGLQNSALISIGQFCENGFEAQSTRQHVLIMDNKDNRIVLKGKHDDHHPVATQPRLNSCQAQHQCAREPPLHQQCL
jgi:hypothetical protein